MEKLIKRKLTMKIKLISPSRRDPRNIGNAFHIPQLSLALLAEMTPTDIDISIIDELIQPIDFDEKADLVGITVSSKTVVRAYEIADEFRSRGVNVVLGGIHPTVASHEAIQHAESLVIGEAEGVWMQVLEDCKKGRLNKFYRSKKFHNLKNCPIPRREFFQRDKYITINLIQTSRGCPFTCHFCSVSSIHGNGLRLRPVDEVIAEIKTLHGDELFFLDDNIVGRTEYAKQLFTQLIPFKKKWVGQASVTVVNNEEILKLLHKSGCLGLLIGFETTSADSLKEIGKNQNVVNNYYETIKKLHDYGISVEGSFIFGFDNHDKSCFEKLLDFAVRSKIDIAQFNILMPYPGTNLYERMKEQNRLIDDKWWLRSESDNVVYRPKLMTREELYQGWNWVAKEFYKLNPMLQRLINGVGRRSLFCNFLAWKVNMGYRQSVYALPEKSFNPLSNSSS